MAPVSRLIREAGADRVSEGARDALAEVLESYGLEVARGGGGLGQPCQEKDRQVHNGVREAVKGLNFRILDR